MGTGCTLPKNTCPIIDDIQTGIEQAHSHILKAEGFLDGLCKDLEEVRTANALLREAAETWNTEIEEVEKERDELVDKLDEANNRIEELELQLKEERKAA